MSGSDSRLPAAQSLTALPFPDPPFPAQPLPGRPSTPEPAPAAWDAGVQVEIVIPVRNEERDLAPSGRPDDPVWARLALLALLLATALL